MSDTLSDRLRRARETAKLSQSELARRVGLSPQAIQHLEAGKAASSRHLVKIAGVLGVEPEWLSLGGTEAPPRVVKQFRLPSSDNQIEKLRAMATHASKASGDNETAERLVYQPKGVHYSPNVLPVFIASSYRRTEMPNIVYDQEERQLRSWLIQNEANLTKKQMNKLVKWEFLIIAQPNPDAFTPRPYYLNGQLEAYGLYIDNYCGLTSRVGKVETLHISPYKRPEPTDIVLIWHKSNSFVVGEFVKQTEKVIEIEHPELLRQLFDNPDLLWSNDPDAKMPDTTIKFPLDQVEAIHTAVGAEFILPQSSRLLATRHHLRSRFSPDEL